MKGGGGGPCPLTPDEVVKWARYLREATGCGIRDCKEAIKASKTLEEALERLNYLAYTRQAVVRSRTFDFEEWKRRARQTEDRPKRGIES